RYLPGSNVLETTFVTAGGIVRVTDAMTLPGVGLSPVRELARRIEGVAGRVPLRWRVVPRFGYASAATRFVSRGAWAVAVNGGDARAICAWGGGRPTVEDRGGGDHVAARRYRRRAELGLPLLLDSRLLVHLGGAAAAGLSRRGDVVLLVVHARDATDAAAAAGVLSSRRRRVRARAHAAARGLSRLAAGADRQRRGRPGAARHVRRAARHGLRVCRQGLPPRHQHRPGPRARRRLRL